MDVDAGGNCLVLNVNAPLDGEWQHVAGAKIASSFWQRLDPRTHARAA